MNNNIYDSEYPYGCREIDLKAYNKENTGLGVLCQFSKGDILDENERKKIFKNIKSGCKEKKVWALLGGTEKNQWICLQVASASNISEEIISDIKCMLPITSKDTRPWKSQFHEKVFVVQYGLDVRCQKYRDMFERFSSFSIIIIEPKTYLKDSNNIYNSVKYAEVKYAYDTQALYWNAIKEEHEILRKIQQKQE
ncbi:hypothetical protein [Lacrimispora sp. JR3]|uniref:hypothetical protein n=1 Tax=Lacrimispora sinapis TaxID=3111456 RepID=UPI0037496673